MSVSIIAATIKSEITVVSQLALGPGATDRVTDVGVNTTALKLNAMSTPPVSAKSHFSQALTSGAANIDLTALKDDQGNTISSTGLRVQAVKVQNPNPDALAVTPAVSNGYGLTFTVPPQGEVLITSKSLLAVIGSSAKNLALAGTGAETSNWMIVLG